MLVKDLMTKKVKSILPNIPVNQAVDLLWKNKISGLPVTDEDSKLIGMLTEKDVIKYILPGYLKNVGSFIYGDNPKAIKNKVRELLEERKVCDIMRTQVIALGPEASLSEVARVMLIEKIRRIPIVDSEGRVIGIIAREDVVKAFIKGDV